MSQIRTNAILDASGGTTATVNGIPLRPGVLDPENRIINGAFDFWQRGTSSTSSGYVAADRWENALVGGTVTQSRQAFAVGDTLGSSNPIYFLRQAVSGQTLSSHLAVTAQAIEGVRSYAGQTITILGWARRSSGSGNMAVELYQFMGSGGSPSADVSAIGVTTVTLTGSFAPFAVTISVPSISGKTLGTNGNDKLALNFWTSAGSNFNARTNSLGLQTIGVDLWGIHIKQGTHTTSAVDLYRQPEMGPELARCQRYHTRLACAIRGSQSFAGQEVIWDTALPVTMRGTPSTVISNASPSGSMNGGPSVANVFADTVTVLSTAFSALNANGACSFTLALDAEL